MRTVLFGAVAVCLLLFLARIYNGLVTARNAYRNAFAQIEVQLQRRYDLIPNLVEIVKSYLQHERQTLEAVTAARNLAASGLSAAKANPGDAQAMRQLSGADSQLSHTLGRLLAVSESYPDLKASQNMMQVTEELTSTENKVAFARQAYNDAVMVYNNKCEMFPNTLIASVASFAPAASWETGNGESKQAIHVSLT